MASPGTGASVPPSALAQVCPSPPSPGPGQRAPPSPGPGQRAARHLARVSAPPPRLAANAQAHAGCAHLHPPRRPGQPRGRPRAVVVLGSAFARGAPFSLQLRPLHPLLARPEFATLCARTRPGFAADPSTRGVRRAGGGSIRNRHAPNRRSRHLQRCCTRARVEVCPAQSERSREAATNSRFQRVPHPAISDVSSWVRQMSLQSRSDSRLAPRREGPGPTPSA